MLIAPIVFATVVDGLGGLGDLQRVGRVGQGAGYFEVVTTVALLIGLVVGHVFPPGAGSARTAALARRRQP